MPYEWILTETHGQVGLIIINRPQAMNALNNQLMRELMDALEAFDENDPLARWSLRGMKKPSPPARTSKRWRIERSNK